MLACADFFNSPDVDAMDLTARLKQLDCSAFHDAFVVYATRAALDRSTDDQRRLSAEIALLHDKGLLTRQQLCRAFEKLVQSTDDIELVRKPLLLAASLLRVRTGRQPCDRGLQLAVGSGSYAS